MSTAGTPATRPTPAQITASYALTPAEAEVVCCLLKGSGNRLQDYWRARAALEDLIKNHRWPAYKEL